MGSSNNLAWDEKFFFLSHLGQLKFTIDAGVDGFETVNDKIARVLTHIDIGVTIPGASVEGTFVCDNKPCLIDFSASGETVQDAIDLLWDSLTNPPKFIHTESGEIVTWDSVNGKWK